MSSNGDFVFLELHQIPGSDRLDVLSCSANIHVPGSSLFLGQAHGLHVPLLGVGLKEEAHASLGTDLLPLLFRERILGPDIWRTVQCLPLLLRSQ